MTRIIDKKWQFFPIVTLIVTMIFGVNYFKVTLEKWVQATISGYSHSLLSDIIYEIEEDNPDFLTLSIDDYIGHLTQASAEQRITVIDPNGVVVGDSALSFRALSGLDNHADRPEYIEAWNNGTGSDIRYSQTLQVDLLYVAQKLYLSGNEYIIRLAVPMHLLGAMEIQLMGILIVLAVVSVALLATSSYISNRQIAARVLKEQELQEERIQQRTYEIELLHRLANMLAACKSIGEAQDVVEDIIPRILGDINGSVAIMRSSRNQLEVKLDWGQPWLAARTYAPEECWSLRKGKFHLTNDDFHCIPCAHMSAVGDDQTMCIPLTAHGNTIGMLHLYFGDRDTKVTQHTRQLAFTVAEHLGLALANLNMQEKLRFQAVSDPLTGLFNRRHFEEQLDLALLNSDRDQQKVSLLMLDLDHFKRFNDNFGHDAGDYVLKTISTLLLDNAASSDVVCRLGGEELAIILPATNGERALTYANQICEKVRDLHLETKGLSLGRLGISIGVASFPGDTVDAEQLVKFADVALYDAKEQGRDRAVLYSSSVEKKKLAQLESVSG